LWVYYYDWRKSISDTASNLASFISSKNLTSVNLIGHSQGGLVARKYAQNNPAKINKLVTIASPHAGALPAFKIWEGADFSDLPTWQNLLVKLYLRINRKSYANDVVTIQSKFPNMQNILPTFEYFNIGIGTKSNFLNTLTSNSLYTISGTNLDTPKTYTISARGTFDKLVGKWVNGKPTGVTNAVGDGTVLLTSGQVTGSLENSAQDNQDHQAIVSNSVTLAKIQSILGISGTVSTSTQSSLANALIITAASPVNFTVTTPANATLTPTNDLLIVNNPSDGNYTVNITPNGPGGAYTVYFGKIKGSDSAWEEVSDNITSGTKTHIFGVQMAQASLGSNPHSNALLHTNDALTAVGSNAILKQDVLRIKSYVNDLNTSAANVVAGFDLRAGRLFSAIDTLTNKAKNTSVTESLRLLKSNVEQLRGDRFGN
jgi:triacylglycerol esterase/lipase EstA (alpha/beta hydrolase family)